MKTQSDEENEVKCTIAQRANDSVILEGRQDDLTIIILKRKQTTIISVTCQKVKKVQKIQLTN